MFKFLLFLLPLFIIGCGSTSINNTQPVADAGKFQYLDTSSTVYLDGSASSDEDHDVLSFQWSFVNKPIGSSAFLTSETSIQPSFFADKEGNYILKLIVNDGEVDSEPAFVTISTITFVDPSTGPQANNIIYTPDSNTMRKQPMIAILLEFSNQKFNSTNEVWRNKLFGTTQGTLNHYYHEISANQFEFDPVNDQGNVVGGIVKVDFSNNPNFNQHPDPNIDITSEYHPYLKAAIESVSLNDSFDFSIYDTTPQDGKITPNELIVLFIMAGGEDAYSGELSGNGIWAHQWCTNSSDTPNVNGVKVMQCDPSGIAEGNYAVFGEQHYDVDNYKNITASHDASIGIIAHELGHSTFNLPDLYYGSSTRIGYYGLMANGSWGQVSSNGVPGDTPTHMTAWSKIDTGWYTASSNSNNPTIDIPLDATGTSTYSIVKTPLYNSNDEYFLVENRGDVGYDAGLKFVNPAFSGGVAIWHIDEAVIRTRRPSNNINLSTSRKGVDLEEAAGNSVDYGNGDPVLNLYYSGNVDMFTPNTLPSTNLYSNERSLIFFTDISSISDTMSIRINNPL